MLETIRRVYTLWGYEALETPFLEYTESLGKFLPDQDRPNAGVFSLTDDDGQWLSLRYDLTAPLARFVASQFETLPRPYRSHRAGPVFRNEKPGPGRFRQFLQCDADIIGSASPTADAELCMMMAESFEALGLSGHCIIRINHRAILDGVMEAIGLAGEEEAGRRLIVLRAIDKYDRLGRDGVRALLGEGRKDESGDFTKGAELTGTAQDAVLAVLDGHFDASQPRIAAGLAELETILDLCRKAGYGPERIVRDTAIVRGLEYYTGPVFEAELTLPAVNEKGQPSFPA
jgi:histidyl-tRNA synthetase